MATGTVKWFSDKKGFGFIVDEQGRDVFVHYTEIKEDGFRSLKEGEKVDYELIEDVKGLKAKQVQKAAGSSDGTSQEESQPEEVTI